MAYDIILGRDAGDKKIFGDKGLIYLGKGYVKMGAYTSLSNKLWMDIVRSHVVMIAGKRGSGSPPPGPPAPFPARPPPGGGSRGASRPREPRRTAASGRRKA